jgi:hypothetical protein
MRFVTPAEKWKNGCIQTPPCFLCGAQCMWGFEIQWVQTSAFNRWLIG